MCQKILSAVWYSHRHSRISSLVTPSNTGVLCGRNYNPCIITISYVWRFIRQTYIKKEKLNPRFYVTLATFQGLGSCRWLVIVVTECIRTALLEADR